MKIFVTISSVVIAVLTLLLQTVYSEYILKEGKPVTVVTSLYLFHNPTKPEGFYINKAKFFLEIVENPMVFFASHDVIE
jgi:hypothetical protein